MEFTSAAGEERYAALAAAARRVVVGLDFDGTLSPIVDDPTRATIHPDAPAVLAGLAARVRAIAVVTGRPVRQALALGLDQVPPRLEAGGELHVFGQYGNERWSSADERIVSAPPPDGLAAFHRGLTALLARTGLEDAFVEEKGLAIAVHTRRLPDPAGALARLHQPVHDLALAHGLVVEPGRHVIEARAPGVHKGIAVRTIVAELGAGGVVFVGDDLGDVEAFEAVAALREQGLATLLVCSASDEQSALVPLSDVVVPGPDGVVELLRTLAHDAA